jgi:hypothetical protein
MVNFILEVRRMTARSSEKRTHCVEACPEAE